MLPAGTDTLSEINEQGFAENDGQNRQGTFNSFSRISRVPYTYSTSNGIKALEIASNPKYTSYDLPLSGINAETDESVILAGNYGVTYKIDVNVTSDDGRAMAIMLNPRGGAYGGYIKTSFPETASSPGQLVPDPGMTVANNTLGGICAIIHPKISTEKLTIELIPAGASSLSIHLLLVPFTSPILKDKTGWVLY